MADESKGQSMMFQALADALSADGFVPLIVTSRLEGDATELGQAMGRLLKKWSLDGQHIFDSNLLLAEAKLVSGEEMANLERQLASAKLKAANNEQREARFALLFGGESTVRFDSAKVSAGRTAPKGGRNQELVLSAFRQLLADSGDASEVRGIWDRPNSEINFDDLYKRKESNDRNGTGKRSLRCSVWAQMAR